MTHLLEPEISPLPVSVAGLSEEQAHAQWRDETVEESDFAEEVTEYMSPLQARQLLREASTESEDTVPMYRGDRGLVGRSEARRG